MRKFKLPEIEAFLPNRSKQEILDSYLTVGGIPEYLQFYFKFVKPIQESIDEGQFNNTPAKAIQLGIYHQWLGYSFERFCRKYHWIIAKILEFSGMRYKHGVYFSKKTQKEEPSYQIDLLFEREDRVYTICEIKYSQNKINSSVIDEFECKIRLFKNPKNRTIQRVLIAPNGVEQAIIERGYFDKIITFDELFALHNW